MIICPRGTKRKMVVQSLLDDPDQYAQENPLRDFSNITEPPPEEVYPESMNFEGMNLEGMNSEGINSENMNPEENTSSDLSKYIFDKLASFGYPQRKLKEVEGDFVTEEMFPDGAGEATIIIPDRIKYDESARLPKSEIQTIIKEIQEKFDFMFTQAKRENKKLILTFNSVGEGQAEEEEEAKTDILDEVYGTNKKKKAAVTIRELIKESQDKFIADSSGE